MKKYLWEHSVERISDDCNELIDNIKILSNALRYKVLEPMVLNDFVLSTNDVKLYMSVGTTKAECFATTEGFGLLAGETINEKI